jgi:hypothetical protein
VTNQEANKIKRQELYKQQIIEQTNMRQQTPSRRANNSSENHRAKQYNRANKQTKSIGDGNSPSQRDCWISNLA